MKQKEFTPTPISLMNQSAQMKKSKNTNPEKRGVSAREIGVNSRSERGFTIIELLVVVAIIAIISAVVIASLTSARQKSRDAQRVEDLRSLVNALNLYSADNQGAFPSIPGNTEWIILDGGEGSGNRDKFLQFEKELVPKYIPVVPSDPRHNDATSYYRYRTEDEGKSYTIEFCLETDSISRYSEGCSNVITP